MTRLFLTNEKKQLKFKSLFFSSCQCDKSKWRNTLRYYLIYVLFGKISLIFIYMYSTISIFIFSLHEKLKFWFYRYTSTVSTSMISTSTNFKVIGKKLVLVEFPWNYYVVKLVLVEIDYVVLTSTNFTSTIFPRSQNSY